MDQRRTSMDVNGRMRMGKSQSILKSHRTLLCARCICLFNVAFTVSFLGNYDINRIYDIMFKHRPIACRGTTYL